MPNEPAITEGDSLPTTDQISEALPYGLDVMTIQQMIGAIWWAEDEKAKTEQIAAAGQFLASLSPKDELERMMAAQMFASHNAAMECYRRAMIPNQRPEGRKFNLTEANKLSRTFTTLVDALNKHRGKGQQKVTVEHVHVHSGGQAIVGNVQGGAGKTEGQAHALGHDQSPQMRCENPQGDAVSITSHEER